MLGRGGMGIVYEAEHPNLDRRVAIKVLPRRAAADQRGLQRFLLEAKAAGKLNHPNAVAIYEVDRTADAYFLVMEKVSGGSAEDFLKTRGPFNWPEATRIIADVCRALTAAHAAGLIHRDIKPANIMRSSEGVVKLADFGLAKHTAGGVDFFADAEPSGDEGDGHCSLTVAGHVVGTPAYMSPEQCRGREVDARSDIYSLGATYYALLTGRAPFDGDWKKMMACHRTEPLPDPRRMRAGIPEACVMILRRATAKNPDERFQSAAAMRRALEEVMAHPEASAADLPSAVFRLAGELARPVKKSSAKAPPATSLPRSRGAGRRLPGWTLPVAVLVGAGLVAAGMYLLLRGSPGFRRLPDRPPPERPPQVEERPPGR